MPVHARSRRAPVRGQGARGGAARPVQHLLQLGSESTHFLLPVLQLVAALPSLVELCFLLFRVLRACLRGLRRRACGCVAPRNPETFLLPRLLSVAC